MKSETRKRLASGTRSMVIYQSLFLHRAVTGIAVSGNGSSVFTTSQGMSPARKVVRLEARSVQVAKSVNSRSGART